MCQWHYTFWLTWPWAVYYSLFFLGESFLYLLLNLYNWSHIQRNTEFQEFLSIFIYYIIWTGLFWPNSFCYTPFAQPCPIPSVVTRCDSCDRICTWWEGCGIRTWPPLSRSSTARPPSTSQLSSKAYSEGEGNCAQSPALHIFFFKKGKMREEDFFCGFRLILPLNESRIAPARTDFWIRAWL